MSSNDLGAPSRKTSRFIKGTTEKKPPNVDGEGLQAMLLHPLCILLICVPLGIASHVLGWGANPTFWLNFLGLVPLAKILGDATEELAAGLKNDMLAGLLNATFGNAVEVVIMAQTLRRGLIDVVKATLLGSVLSNLLLVLGCSFFFGGVLGARGEADERAQFTQLAMSKQGSASVDDETEEGENRFSLVGEKIQTFSVMSAMVNTSLLLLSCLSLSLVTVFYAETHDEDVYRLKAHLPSSQDAVVEISRTCAVVMMLSYCAYIFFQLVTHREAMAEDEGDGGDEGEGDEPAMSIPAALGVMCVCTLMVALSSELLVQTLEDVVLELGISSHFIGIVLLPIVGNACEHASAIRFAIQDKPGLSIGIAVGSSTQISLFVVPFSVLCGWAINMPMDLNFGSLNTTVLSLSVIVILSVVVDGNATWLQGYLLISAYLIIGVLYWHLPDKMRTEVL